MDSLPEIDLHNMSAGDLAVIQTNFNALQQKFVNLMEEKVQLLDKLQENDHLIVQLSHETETIGTKHMSQSSWFSGSCHKSLP